MTYEEQYLALGKRVLSEGVWVDNKRTGTRCLTIPEHTLWYEPNEIPLLTVKQSYPVAALAEMLGYLRRYEWADQFDSIGASTWYTNANETKTWLNSPHRLEQNHIGKVYGAALEDWELPELFSKLMQHEDDRRLMINFWRPEKFHLGALPPCMYKHSFTILDGVLHMSSESRSMDYGLGGNFNSLQCWFLMKLICHVTGLKAGRVKHNIINAHIYESHIPAVTEMLSRTPQNLNVNFKIKGWVESFSDIIDCNTHAKEYFSLRGYTHQGKLPMELIA